ALAGMDDQQALFALIGRHQLVARHLLFPHLFGVIGVAFRLGHEIGFLAHGCKPSICITTRPAAAWGERSVTSRSSRLAWIKPSKGSDSRRRRAVFASVSLRCSARPGAVSRAIFSSIAQS